MNQIHIPARRIKATLASLPATVWLLGTHAIFGGDCIELVTPRGDPFARALVSDSFWETWVEKDQPVEYTKVIIENVVRNHEPSRAA